MKYSILTLSLALTLFAGHVSADASCPKCRIIESDRAAQGPQNVGYYDDSHKQEITPNTVNTNTSKVTKVQPESNNE